MNFPYQYLLIIFLSSFIVSCQQTTENNKEILNNNRKLLEKDTVKQNRTNTFTIQIIEAPKNTFGYDISKNGKTYIHQPHIPGVSGIKGFDSKEKAQKTAEFIVYKIRNSIIPPTINRQELDSLGVLK